MWPQCPLGYKACSAAINKGPNDDKDQNHISDVGLVCVSGALLVQFALLVVAHRLLQQRLAGLALRLPLLVHVVHQVRDGQAEGHACRHAGGHTCDGQLPVDEQ